jgi:3-oxoacyl-[acyl-carrier-protein] synthase-1
MSRLQLSHYTLSSSLGVGLDAHVSALLSESSGLRPVDYDGIEFPAFTGQVTGIEDIRLTGPLQSFNCRNNRLAQLALAADNFTDHVQETVDRYGAHRVGLFLGTSTSGVQEGELAYAARGQATGALPSTFHYNTTQAIFSLGDFVRRSLRLLGPTEVISTACSSSAKVFAVADRFIQAGLCDAAVVGGVDSLCQMTLCGFNSLQLVSSRSCRPSDKDRDGLSIGEAAGFALLERPTDSAGIGLLGYGESSDAWHMSTPNPEGIGAAMAMQQALDKARLQPDDIDYINLHGTATPANDLAEDAALCSIFDANTPCSSTKGYTGHTLGAAGIVEALISCIAIDKGVAFKSLNTEVVDPAIHSPILLEHLRMPIDRVMSNSFGFGGSNAALIFGRLA